MVDDDTAARLLLLSLPGLGPARLTWLLAEATAPEVVTALRRGSLPPVGGQAPPGLNPTLIRRWTAELRATTEESVIAASTVEGVGLLGPSHPLWPFVDDPEPPGLLFTRGDLGLLEVATMVAVVGTRRCTAVGRQVATDLGADLAEAGVVVVSGLALGIDGCAHTGALAAGGRPLAVVGTGLDVVYPAGNRRLWARVADEGLVVSEAPMGARPERWRFPARNRLIAALADAVVVVESHTEGGSMHTVHEAGERGRLVMAVPGAVTNPAAAGPNELLAEGCPPVRHAADVLDALGVVVGATGPDARAATEQLRLHPAAEPDPVQVDGPGSAPSRGPLGPSASPALGQSGSAAGGDEGDESLAAQILREVAAGSIHVDDLVAVALQTGTASSMGGEPFDGRSRELGVREVLAEIQQLVLQGRVQLDGSTVVLRQQPPL